jgi:hypothetical protein
MRYNEIVRSIAALRENIVQDVELDEVRMGQSDLNRFVASEAGAKIIAGFEAELCFRGMGGDSGELDYENGEPDFDSDESCVSIDDAVRFFHDGDFNGRREVTQLRARMEEAFYEWQSEQLDERWSEVEDDVVREYIEEYDWDTDDKIKEYLSDEMELDASRIADVLHAGEKAGEMTSSKQLILFRSQDEDYATYMEAVDATKQMLDDYVADSIESQDRNYEAAREAWIEEQREDDTEDRYSESAWLNDNDMSTMRDVWYNYDSLVQWPHYSYPPANEGGFNHDSAIDLARRLRQALDVRVKASSGYHSTKRESDLWIIEEDGSLHADDSDDMPCEIVSPPMPLALCIEKMREFFAWAQSEDAYSNDSTGLHVGISMPDIGGSAKGELDYLKLALFLGDKKVLEDFGREGNHYCQSSLEKIGSQIRHVGDSDLQEAIDEMRTGLIQMARKTLGQSGGHGKYSSVNLKNDYIEFRGMGGENYIDNINTVLNTVQRFAYAYSIASDPKAEREEYGKKLYKLLHQSLKSKDIINSVFVQYKGGEGFRPDMLKQILKQAQLARDIERQENDDDDIKVGDWEPDPPSVPRGRRNGDEAQWDSSLSRRSAAYWEQMLTRVVQSGRPKYWYEVKWRHSAMKIEVVATNPSEAIVRAKIDVSEWRTIDNSEFETNAIARYEEGNTSQSGASSQAGGQHEYQVYNRRTGHVARRFYEENHDTAVEYGNSLITQLRLSGLISDPEDWSIRRTD